jgi:predicted nucleic acid-binding protein
MYALERHLTVLPDSPVTYGTWRQLVAAHNVRGVKVHDAWLVAAMKTHGISQILTFNAGDFTRYDGIKPVNPQDL